MALRIVPYDELPRRLDPERLALTLGAFSSALDRRSLEVYRRRQVGPVAYVGLFALEDGELLGQAFALNLNYRSLAGTERLTGVSSVTTRADARRRGVATALLREVHRRERAAGTRFSLLWTSQGWFAHRLYEKLGYRDIYTPPVAVRLVAHGRRAPNGETLRPVRPPELPALEALHRDRTAGGYGFVPRSPDFLRRRRAAGARLHDVWVYRVRGRLAGYAVVSDETRQLRCGELVARPDDVPGLLDALERRAAPGLMALGNTPVMAWEPELRRRGYVVRRNQEWRVLMACPLGRAMAPSALRRELAVDRPSFTCMTLDRF